MSESEASVALLRKDGSVSLRQPARVWVECINKTTRLKLNLQGPLPQEAVGSTMGASAETEAQAAGALKAMVSAPWPPMECPAMERSRGEIR